jgi:hypothetical protein
MHLTALLSTPAVSRYMTLLASTLQASASSSSASICSATTPAASVTEAKFPSCFDVVGLLEILVLGLAFFLHSSQALHHAQSDQEEEGQGCRLHGETASLI